MISLKPDLYQQFRCPYCTEELCKVEKIIFQGLHILASTVCGTCKNNFLMDFPIGNALLYPTIIDKQKNALVGRDKYYRWFHKSLLKAYNSPSDATVNIKKIIKNKCEKVIILNCTDVLYGHVLLKLFNATQYLERYPEEGLIIILPKSFAWLVPEGVAEIWLIDLKLSEFNNWYIALENLIEESLSHYQEVYLSLAYPIPSLENFSITPYSKVSPFSLVNFYRLPLQVSFIWREDRFWTGSGFEELLFLAFKKFSLLENFTIFRAFFCYFQALRLKKLTKKIKKVFPQVQIKVIGLGRTGSFSKAIQDLREDHISFEKEKEWCEQYAKSQVVVGIHGSNMLLPTAHAAGFVEIIPHDRLGNWLQDIALPFTKRMDSFLGRLLPAYSKPKLVAKHVINILSNYEKFYVRNAPELHFYEKVDNVNERFKSGLRD